MENIRKALAALYALFIVYYTLLCRSPGIERIFKPLFWELSRGAWRDIGLNILLFVPLGFLLGSRKGILYGFLVSVFVEITQLVFCLGFCELDDVLNNMIGTVIGTLIFVAAKRIYRIVNERM